MTNFSFNNVHLTSAPWGFAIFHICIKKQSCSQACYNKNVNGAVNWSELYWTAFTANTLQGANTATALGLFTVYFTTLVRVCGI